MGDLTEERQNLRIRFERLPPRFHDSMRMYLSDGVPLGDFLGSCMEDRLVYAYLYADDTSLTQIHDIVRWMYNDCPMDARGSVERVATWMRERKENPYEVVVVDGEDSDDD